MINRLPLTVGFARVSQATEDQGNLETQTQQFQDYGVHEVVTEIGVKGGGKTYHCGGEKVYHRGNA
jgi:predicted site-specific integrase-resolvase